MPLISGQPLLDVTLRLGDKVRRWTITPWSMGWTFRFVDSGTVTVSGYQTRELMESQRQKWEAEIAAARAEGWT